MRPVQANRSNGSPPLRLRGPGAPPARFASLASHRQQTEAQPSLPTQSAGGAEGAGALRRSASYRSDLGALPSLGEACGITSGGASEVQEA
jgi:hypothetical protein